ncbi:MAG: hypothetical protein AAGE98_18855 [Actinomycetota bacterium]
MLAAVGDTPYNIFLFIHIVTAAIGFAPVFVVPLLGRRGDGPGAGAALMDFVAQRTLRIYGNAIVLSGLIGFGVAGLSDKVYRVRQPWLIAAVILWTAILGLLHSGVIPAERAIANADGRDEAAEQRLHRFGTAITVLFCVQIYLMVFKPGL